MTLNSPFKNSLLISTATHIAFLALVFVLSKWTSSQHNYDRVEITLVENPFDQIREMPNPKLIVETDSQAANNQIDEKAQYLSEKSNTVEKETRAKTGQKFSNVQARPRVLQKPQVTPQQKATEAQRQLFENSFDAVSAVNRKMTIENALSQAQKKQAARQPSANTASAQQESSTNDHLENVQDDLMTRLNTREYKYFGYYNRIKNQLNQWWVPQVQQKFTKMMRQGRSIASEENKVTKLVIVLNDTGNLVKVQVLAESGVRDLDDAAVEAFRQAAPFPNPPKGMIEKDGHVRIRWDCIVES